MNLPTYNPSQEDTDRTLSSLVPPNQPPTDQLMAMFDPEEFRNLRSQATWLQRVQSGNVIAKAERQVLSVAYETVTKVAAMKGQEQIDAMRELLKTVSEHTRSIESQRRMENAANITASVIEDFENRLVQIEKSNIRPELKQLLTDRLTAELRRFMSSTDNS